MEKIYKILIFTDLDATLLDRDTFQFDAIKEYLKQLLSDGIFIIPNSSKTEKEILEFNNLSRKNPRKAYKTILKSLKKEKCIGEGVTEGGNHGKTFMPEYLAFWKENLLN